MSLVFTGACSHGPGITGRWERADAQTRDALLQSFTRLRAALTDSEPDALVVIAAEHFANFFMNNMPAFCIGMADQYEGPIEDEDWLAIDRTDVPGAPDLSQRLIQEIMVDVDVAYAQEWKFDHGIMVPLHFVTPEYDLPIVPVNINCQGPPLTPLHRAYAFGRALRRACDAVPERLAVLATSGGVSHWPCTPDSGRINEDFDRQFLSQWAKNDYQALTSYTDEETIREGGQGAFEMRTLVALAGTANGGRGELWFYAPIPDFACGCMVGVMNPN